MQQIKIGLLLLVAVIATTGPALANKPLPNNKQLVIGIPQEFETLQPFLAGMAASHYIGRFVGHPLNSINADWEWQCWLCTKMPTFKDGDMRFVTHEGKKMVEVDFEIHKKARWGDGVPVTGHDFKISWTIGKSNNVATQQKAGFEILNMVKVNEKNPKKFTVRYSEPEYGAERFATFYLIPNHLEAAVWEKTKDEMGAYEKQTLYSLDPTNPGLYMGPYVVEELKLASHVTLKRNPYFYGKKPAIERIVIKWVPSAQTLEANLISGTIDMIGEIGMSFDQAVGFEERIRQDKDLSRRFEVIFREGPIYEHIDFRNDHEILKDRRIRRALAYGADRQKLVQALFKNRQKVAIHNVHPLDYNFTDDVMQYPYDPEKAGKLLDEAGWKMGKEGYRVNAKGEKLSFILMTTAENKTRELVQVFLQNEWKKIGVHLKFKNEPPRVFFGSTVHKMKYPHMAMYAWYSSPDNPSWTSTHSSEIPTEANGWSGQNRMAWVNEANDKALEEIRVNFDQQRRKELMAICQNEYAKELPALPLYYRAQVVVIPKNLRGFKVTGHQFYSALSAHEWYLK